MIQKSRLAALLFFIAVTATACKGPMELAFIGTQEMNGGNALEVVLFQLSSNAAFENTPAVSFWENDNAALAGDLVSAKQKYTLFPESSQTLEIKPVKGALYVGIAANYRFPDAQGWRVIYAVDEIKGKAVRLTAGSDRLFAEIR